MVHPRPPSLTSPPSKSILTTVSREAARDAAHARKGNATVKASYAVRHYLSRLGTIPILLMYAVQATPSGRQADSSAARFSRAHIAALVRSFTPIRRKT